VQRWRKKKSNADFGDAAPARSGVASSETPALQHIRERTWTRWSDCRAWRRVRRTRRDERRGRRDVERARSVASGSASVHQQFSGPLRR